VPEATADAVMERLGGRTPVVFCDFDGVLSEIVNDPDAATITPANQDALRQLVRACPVAVVSGRGAPDVAGRLGLDGLYVAGSHGFELIAPDGTHTVQDRAAAKAEDLGAAADALQAEVGGIDGVLVENKRFSIAVHYRNADPSTHERVQAAVVAEGERRGLISSGGKMIRELRPPLPWDKGAAVIDLLGRIAPDPDAPAIYLGDDLTDEDAFRVLRGWGVSIAVRGGDHATVADLAVDVPDGIAALLAELGRRLT
jgi:trehalose 6-phosphate phosphatase